MSCGQIHSPVVLFRLSRVSRVLDLFVASLNSDHLVGPVNVDGRPLTNIKTVPIDIFLSI